MARGRRRGPRRGVWLLLLGAGPAATSGARCSASGGGAEDCLRALDGNTSSVWASGSVLPAWLEAEPFDGAAHALGTYALTAGAEPSAAPSSWLLEAIHGDRRIFLDEATAASWRAGQTRIREVRAGGGFAFARFRLTIRATQGAGHAELAELQLLPLVALSFRTGDWGACSASCAGGRQQRSVVCHGSDGVDYNDARCGVDTKPPTEQQCNNAPCTCSGLLCGVPCAASSRAVRELGCSVAADGLTSTVWTSDGPLPHWLSFTLSEPVMIRAFVVTASSCSECARGESPGSLALLGSSDGAGWVELSRHGGLGPWGTSQRRTFRIVPPAEGFTAYRHYRLSLDAAPDSPDPSRLSVAEVELLPTDTQLTLELSSWGPCEGVAGEGSCGSGRQERSVVCRGASGRTFPLQLCDGGTNTAKVRGCALPCPQVLGANVTAHLGRFGAIVASLEVSAATAVACAAFELPADGSPGQQPSEGDIVSASLAVRQLCDPATCSLEIHGLGSGVRETRYNLWCTVPGSGNPRREGLAVRLEPVPELRGCFGDASGPMQERDLPFSRGTGRSQKDCSAACLGFSHFALQARGDCHCGDFYGRYGPRVANPAEGILGCNCGGPYFGFQANCVWSHNKRGAALQILELSRATSSTLELLVAVEANTSVTCNAMAPGAAGAAAELACPPGECRLLLRGLGAGVEYSISCVTADAEAASLLARTAEAPAEGTPAPTTVMPTAAAPQFRAPTPAPSPPTYDSPGAELPFVALVFALLALGGPAMMCRKIVGFAELELAQSFWLLWEAAATLDLAAGIFFLWQLLQGEAEGWSALARVAAGSVICAGEVHAIGFIVFGCLPLAGLRLAEGVSRERRYEMKPLHHRHRPETKRGKKPQPAPPPDDEESPSPLLFLPVFGLCATCSSDEDHLRQAASRKLLLRGAVCAVQDVPLLACCCASWAGEQGLSGASLFCAFTSAAMGLLLALGLRRAARRGGMLPTSDSEALGLHGLHLQELPPPPPAPAPGKQRRRPEANEGRVHRPGDLKAPGLRNAAAAPGKTAARQSALRLAAAPAAKPPGKPRPELQTPASPWGVAPLRGEAPKPLPSVIGGC